MTASPWYIFHGAKAAIGAGTIDLDTHTFKCALVKSTWTPDLAGDEVWADISAHDATAGTGYTAGGKAMTGVTWSNSSGTMTFDADNPEWEASGGTVEGRYAVIYDYTDAAKTLLAYCLMDTTPADVVATAGATLSVRINAAGIFTLT